MGSCFLQISPYRSCIVASREEATNKCWVYWPKISFYRSTTGFKECGPRSVARRIDTRRVPDGQTPPRVALGADHLWCPSRPTVVNTTVMVGRSGLVLAVPCVFARLLSTAARVSRRGCSILICHRSRLIKIVCTCWAL